MGSVGGNDCAGRTHQPRWGCHRRLSGARLNITTPSVTKLVQELEARHLLEKYADKYQLIPNGHLVCAAEDARLPELFLALDCGDEGRLGDAAEFFQKAKQHLKPGGMIIMYTNEAGFVKKQMRLKKDMHLLKATPVSGN